MSTPIVNRTRLADGLLAILWDERTGWLSSPLFVPVLLTGMAGCFFALSAATGAPITAIWGYDFEAFHTGARLAWEGRLTDAYDAAAFQAALPDPGEMFWMYPPHGSLLLSPLGALPYGVAAALFVPACAGAAFAAGRLAGGQTRHGSLLALASLPALFGLLLGQLAPVLGALLVGGVLLAPRRPVLAGLLFALLTIKPHYGLLVPVLLASRGWWRCALTAAAGGGALFAASLMAFGPEAWHAFAAASDGPAAAFIYDELYPSMPTVFQYARFYGAGEAMAFVLQGTALVLAATVLWRARRLPYERQAALCLILACAVMPYAWFYDWLAVMAACCLLGRPGVAPDVPTPLLAMVWFVPLLSDLSVGLAARVAPVMVVGGANAVELAVLSALIVQTARPHAAADAYRFLRAGSSASASSVSVGTNPSI